MDHSATVSHSLVTGLPTRSFFHTRTCLPTGLLIYKVAYVRICLHYTYVPLHTPTYLGAYLLAIAYLVSLLGTYSPTCLYMYVEAYVRSYLSTG
jgi:hypothetical protein